MKRRWIIRIFFIGLLLLLVCGWVTSFVDDLRIYRFAWHAFEFRSREGTIYLSSFHAFFEPGTPIFPAEWGMILKPCSEPLNQFIDPVPQTHFGFTLHYGDYFQISFLFWLLTIIFSAMLWLAWRKTRPKLKGRAFPVEADTTHK